MSRSFRSVTQLILQLSDFENVLVTISFLLRKNPYQVLLCLSGPVHGCQPWSSEHYSFSLSSFFSAYWSIEALLHKWNLKCLNIPQEKFHANKDQLAGSTLPGSHTVQMIITEDKESWMKDNCQLILQLLLARHIQSHQIVMTQYKINGSKQFKLYSISVLLKFYNK